MNKKNLIVILIAINLNFTFGQWQNLKLKQPTLAAFKVANRIFAGTLNGIYYKLESDTAWTLATGISTKATNFTAANNVLYVSSYEKIYKSTDNGNTWKALAEIYSFKDINTIVINKNNTLLAGLNGGGIYYSEDAGNNWTNSGSSWQGPNSAIIKKGAIYFSSNKSSGYLQKSLDETGKEWTSAVGNGIKVGSSTSFQDITTLATINDEILVAGTNNFGVAKPYDGIYFSTDNGDNFTKKINGISNPAINSIVTIGNLIFAGSQGGGVYYSSDEGLNWTSINAGLTNLNINRLYANQSSLFACTDTGFFKIDVCYLLKSNSKITPSGSITISSGDNTELKANLGGINYVWYQDNVIISGANSFNYKPTQTGSYKAVVEYAAACTDTTNTVNVTVQNSSIKENNYINKLSLFPNPVKETIFIKNNNHPEYEIFDLLGKLVQTGNATDNKINVQLLKNGIYLLKIKTDEHSTYLKFIKE